MRGGEVIDEDLTREQALQRRVNDLQGVVNTLEGDLRALKAEVERLKADMQAPGKAWGVAKRLGDKLEAAQARVKELEVSCISHFQRDHLEGDGPEIDRWKRKLKEAVGLLEECRSLIAGAIRWDSDRWGDLLNRRFTSAIARINAFLTPVPMPHPDDLAVDAFAVAMKAKLAKKRDEGRGGWERPDECPPGRLSALLLSHLEKGDPVDIANFAMMLWHRCEKITPAPQGEPEPQQPAAEPDLKLGHRFVACEREPACPGFHRCHKTDKLNRLFCSRLESEH
jgi:hypothetical protein